MYLLPAVLARGLVLLASCLAGEGGDDAAVPALPPFVAPHYVVVSDEPAVRSGLPSLPDPGDEFFVEEFTTLDRARWSEASGGDGPATGPSGGAILKHLPNAPGAQGVVVVAAGRGALRGCFDVHRSDAMIVTLRARSFATGTPARLRAVQTSPDDPEPSVFEAPIAATAAFAETRFVVDRQINRRRLELELHAGDGPLSIDRIECQYLRPVEREWLLPRRATDDVLPASRQRIASSIIDTEMEGCLVPVGGVVRWRTRVPARAPRLDVMTTLIGGDRGGSVEWVVEVDEAAIASRSETIVPGERNKRLSPWIVPLEKWAGREVVLALRCAGDRSVVGFAGAPRVLSPAPAEAPPNVVLISLDTLRADRVGPRKGAPSLTPRLDELARRGALFTDAASTSSWTLPAHASLFTGQHPLVHGMGSTADRLDPARSRMLAERYRAAGYATAAFTSGGMVDPHFGFARGFETYSVRDPCGVSGETIDLFYSGLGHRPTDEEIDASPRPAFDWIRRHADGRFFVFFHTYNVHDYDDPCATGKERQRTALMDRADHGDREVIRELVRRYDNLVPKVDATLVGGLLDLLDELSLREKTLVVVVSDHGEEFGEHGRYGHGIQLTPEVGSIVMVAAGPGVPSGVKIDKPVNLTDVSGTLARLTGLPPDPEWRGFDLFAPPAAEPRCRVLILDNGWSRAEAMWIDHWRVHRVWDAEGKQSKITLEKRNPDTGAIVAVDATDEQIAILERRLDFEMAQRLPKTSSEQRDDSDLSPALRARLKALGYLDH
jgi:arylsulfatase A-like enzyme